jgi:ClpP class serine protease
MSKIPKSKPTSRKGLIQAIERERKSRVLTYVLSDRRGSSAQVAEDAVRPMYDHLLNFGKQPKIDLFLFSIGGHLEVPWRIISMLREFTSDLAVLLPYKAMSAATLISLGADEIVMGRKGELGPIDPQLTIQRGGGETAAQETMSVEDVMSYLRFVKERAGLTDQQALADAIKPLADKLNPWVLGQISRVSLHIREVARKLLTSRGKRDASAEQRLQVIIEMLAEKTYQHGHAIGRQEAKEIGLNITNPNPTLEALMWDLFCAYENEMGLRDPLDPRTFVPSDKDEHSEANVLMGCIESANLSHQFRADLRGKAERKEAHLTVNLNLNLQLPAGFDPATLNTNAQQTLQTMLAGAQAEIQRQITQQIREQMPVKNYQLWTQNDAWRLTDRW